MTTPQEHLDYLKEEQKQELLITQQKNGDYSGKDNDAYSNFRRYGEIQLLSRMYEKFSRIENIILKKETHCPEETIVDTLRDLRNYCSLLGGFLEDKKRYNKSESKSV